MNVQAPWSQELYLKAMWFAAAAHNGQTIPDTDLPYLVHIGMVSMEVLAALGELPADQADLAVQCSLLHDVLEDTATPYDLIVAEFGEAVAKGVKALSKNPRIDKPLRMTDSLNRIRQQPQAVWIVKLADRITNLQPPPASWSKTKAERYHQESLVILESLGEASQLLAQRLTWKIMSYENLVQNMARQE